MKRAIFAIVLISAAGLQAGCFERAKDRVSFHFQPQHAITNWTRDARFEQLGIRRVAVLGFVDTGRYAEASERLTDAFALELRKTRRFDVTVCPADTPLARLATARSSFDAVEARLLGEALNADGVVIGEIVEYQPYKPIAIGLRVFMIDTRSGRVVWTVDEMLDTAELAVSNLARQYYYDVVDPAASQFQEDQVLLSMRTFARCVAYHFVRTLDRPLTFSAPTGAVSAGAP